MLNGHVANDFLINHFGKKLSRRNIGKKYNKLSFDLVTYTRLVLFFLESKS